MSLRGDVNLLIAPSTAGCWQRCWRSPDGLHLQPAVETHIRHGGEMPVEHYW